MTVTLSNSHSIWKSTYPIDVKPLTSQDDSIVPTRYRYIVAARMLYKDYYGKEKIRLQQLYTIQQQDLRINALLKTDTASKRALNECDSIKNKQQLLLDNAAIQHSKDVWALRGNQAKKIGLGITIPVVAVISFLLGWYLH